MRKTSDFPLIQDFLSAVSFLTLLPVSSGTVPIREQSLARATLFFPAVGFGLGFFAYACFYFADLFLPYRAAILVLLTAPILVSGALHIDGFADFCDGFGGGKNKEDILRIMKDPRVGSFGVAGTVLLLLAKFELLCSLPNAMLAIIALAASRWMQVLLSFFLPYAGTEGLGTAVAGQLTSRELGGATALFFPLLFVCGIQGLMATAGLLLFAFFFSAYVRNKIGGVTGDVLGASSELTELLILIILNLRSPYA